MRSTKYAQEIARADEGGARIERFGIRSTGADEIRFPWWKDGRVQPRPPDQTGARLVTAYPDEGS